MAESKNFHASVYEMDGVLDPQPRVVGFEVPESKVITLRSFNLEDEGQKSQAKQVQESIRRQHFHQVNVTYEALETNPGDFNRLRKDTVNNIALMQYMPPYSLDFQEAFSEYIPDESLREEICPRYSTFFEYVHREVALAVLSPQQCERIFDRSYADIENMRHELPVHLLPAAEELTEKLLEQYFVRLNETINEEKLREYEAGVCHKLDNYNDYLGLEHVRSKNIILLNGPVGAGKGTTLEGLEAEAVETGTAGLGGRGGQSREKRDNFVGGPNRYDRWEYVSGGLDRSRRKQRRFPDRVMRLWLAIELEQKRVELDAEEKYHEPIYISGYPREVSQTLLFAALNQEKVVSVYMEISEEEAAKRTIGRMIEQGVASAMEARNIKNEQILDPEKEAKLAKLEYYRGDDLVSLDFARTPSIQKIINDFRAQMDLAVKLFDSKNTLSLQEAQRVIKERFFNFYAKELQRLQLERGINNGKREARYHLDMRNKADIIKASASMGIETHIVICDGKAPSQVTEDVARYVKAA